MLRLKIAAAAKTAFGLNMFIAPGFSLLPVSFRAKQTNNPPGNRRVADP
jgi:hypothetical protein